MKDFNQTTRRTVGTPVNACIITLAVAMSAGTTSVALGAVDVTAATRSIDAWTSVYDWKFDDDQTDAHDSTELTGPFQADVATDVFHVYLNEIVAAGAGALDSTIECDRVHFAIETSGSVSNGNVLAADSGAQSDVNVQFTVTSTTHAVLDAWATRTSPGYSEGSTVLTGPTGPIAQMYLHGGDTESLTFEGDLLPGDYTLSGSLIAWALGGEGTEDDAAAELEAELTFYDLADMNHSGNVDFADLLMIMAAWGACGECPEDLNDDGVVAFGDVLMLIQRWGGCGS